MFYDHPLSAIGTEYRKATMSLTVGTLSLSGHCFNFRIGSSKEGPGIKADIPAEAEASLDAAPDIGGG